MTDHVTAWAKRVAAGKVPCGQLQRAAAERHLCDLEDRKRRGWTWDAAHAADVIAFFSHLRQWKGEFAGAPLTLEPWQGFIIGSLFGWARADGLRRFSTAFVEVPRGNGKSTLCAGLALYMLLFDDEPGADIYAIATKKDQARIVFEAARQIAIKTPQIKARLGHLNGKLPKNNLFTESTASKFEPLGADEDTLDGLRPHLAIADEVHAHKSSGLINVIQTGMGTRRQPLLFEITTAGTNRNGPWWEHREYSRRVLEQRHDDESWFAFIAGADEGDDWRLDATWRKANPNYGISVKPDYLASECRKAQGQPMFQNDFRRLYCGQLVNQVDRVIDMRAWDACADPSLELDDFIGRRCIAGLDLSTTTDLCALVLVFPDDDGGMVWFPWFWVPEAKIAERAAKDKVPYQQWAHAGHLTATPGNVVDYGFIREHIRSLHARFRVTEVAYDPWNATQVATELAGDGVPMVPVTQGYKSLSEPTKRLLADVPARRMRHPAHPVLTWCAENLAVSTDPAGNLKPDKSKATDRIDGIVAGITALNRLIVQTDNMSSVYDTQPIRILGR